MRFHAGFIVFIFSFMFLILSSISSPHSDWDRKRRDDSSYDIFTNDNEDSALLSVAAPSEVTTGSLADDETLFQNDLFTRGFQREHRARFFMWSTSGKKKRFR